MTAFLFPGQGSQQPGMGKDLRGYDEQIETLFETADGIAPAGFLDVVFGDDADAVNNTRIAQPALLLVSTALAYLLDSRGVRGAVCAGHSLGEITALVYAKVIPFEEAFKLTLERARLMSENVPEGGMAAVMGLAPEAIEAALPDSVQVANFNSPAQTIITGTQEGLQHAAETLKAAGAKRVMPLKVSGPFHSRHMTDAAEGLKQVLTSIPFSAPNIRFISSVSGKEETDPEIIRQLLSEQLTHPVRWLDVMDRLDVEKAFEVGPGTVLAGLAKRTPGAPAIKSAGTLEAIDQLIES